MATGIQVSCGGCAAINSVDPGRMGDGARCGRCKAPLVASAPIEVGDDQLAALIGSAKLPVFVDFWAAWCGPCRAVAPHVAALAQRHAGRVIVAKVDTDRHQRHMAALDIRSIPTLVLYKGGKVVLKQAGAAGPGQLDQLVAPHL
jgi:thioredoxin 2